MVVKVYGPVRAACPQRVLACLLEKSVEFEIVHVDLDQNKQKHPEFLLIQPFGQVPVIEDGDLRLFESRAIARYYAEKYYKQGPNLLGITLEERAIVDQWVEVEAHIFDKLVYNIVYNLVVLPRLGQVGDSNLAHSSKQRLKAVFDVYEHRLSKSKYLAGESYSLADLSHMPGMRYLIEEVGLAELVKERRHVNAWWEDISSRPAWKQLMELANY